MGVIMKSKPLADWAPLNDKEFRYEGSNRYAKRLIIGTMQQAGGAEQYVIEGIFSDLLPLIKSKQIKVHVDLYSEPKFVLEMNGRLVIHNENVKILKEETLEYLNQEGAMMSNQIRALVELRNNAYSQEVLGRATKSLRIMLSDGMPAKLNYDFIRLILREKYAAPGCGNPLAEEFFRYTKEELVCVYGGILEKKKTGVVRIEPMRSIVEDKKNDYSLEQIETALKDEIVRRFFEGSIR